MRWLERTADLQQAGMSGSQWVTGTASCVFHVRNHQVLHQPMSQLRRGCALRTLEIPDGKGQG